MNNTRSVWAINCAILLFSLTRTVWGCSCGQRPPTYEAYRLSSDVFIGTVVDLEQPPIKATTNQDGSVSFMFPAGPRLATLKVGRSLKGVQGTKVVFELGTDSCSFPFELNETYLVYGVAQDGKVNTGKCTRTQLLSKAGPDLRYIEGLMAGKSQATLYGDVFRQALDDYGKSQLFPPRERLTILLQASTDERFESTADEWGEYEITVPPGGYQLWCERQGERISGVKQYILLKEGECRRLILPVEFIP
jgi:hypothetical protein